MRYEHNKKGWELFNLWEQKYFEENDRLGGNSAEGDFVDGWCIIDTTDHIHNITDVCGLYVFGYDDDAIWEVEDHIERFGNEEIWSGCGFTFEDLKQELKQYFN